MDIRILDLVVIVVYFGGITLAGLYFAKRNKNTEDYFVGGRNFPGWAIGLSMVGTSISSLTFMAYPGDAYKTAWLRLMGCFTMPIAILIAAIWFLPFYRRGKITSAYEYLEKRFGPKTRVYAAVIFLIGQIMRLGTVLFLLSLLVEAITGWNPVICIILGGLFVSFYTVVGGIEAVVWTDVVQTIVLVLGGLLCLVFISMKLPGGLFEIFSVAWADGKFSIAEATLNSKVPFAGAETAFEDILTFEPTSWGLSVWRKTGLMMLLLGFSNWIYEYSCNQLVIQRYCASKNAREARKAMWICCFSSIPIWTYFMFLGTAMYVFFKAFPNEEAYQILVGTGGHKAEEILPFFVINFLPAGISGLVVAAVMAAAMSSLDSSINAISTICVVDIYRRHMVKDGDERHYLLVARGIAIASSILMILLAIWFNSIDMKTFQDTGIILFALFSGGLLGIYMLGFLTTWGDGRALFVGVIVTTIYSVWMGAQELEWIARPENPWLQTDGYYTGNIAHFIMFLIGFFLGGLMSKIKGEERDLTNLTVWTQDGTPLD